MMTEFLDTPRESRRHETDTARLQSRRLVARDKLGFITAEVLSNLQHNLPVILPIFQQLVCLDGPLQWQHLPDLRN